jgi:drug/metabolite transporter (DMT)-like permease
MEEKRGLVLVLFAAIISGFSIFINSYGVKGFDSSVFTFSKNIVVAVLLFAIILGLGKFNELKKLSRKNWLQLSAIGFVGGSVPFLLFFKGLQLTTSSTSAFIHKTMFLFVAIMAIIFLKEKLSKSIFIGALLLLIGTYLMIRPDFNLSTAQLLILAATILWAAENVISKYVLKELSGTVVAFGRMFFGALFILAFLIVTDKSSYIVAISFSQFLWISFTSVLLFLFVFSFYNGLKSVKATTAASILVIGAPITSLLQVIFQNVVLSISDVFGIIFICSGTILIIWFTSVSKLIANVRQSERN